MATQKNTKEPVRIRQKALADGNISLYLDIYYNGERTYEFLKLYLIPEKTKENKAKNAETLRLAEAVKSLRIVDIQSGRYGFKDKYKPDTNFFEFYDTCVAERFKGDSTGNTGNWRSCRKHLAKFYKQSTTLGDITEKNCIGFKNYLEKKATTPAGQPLSQNSQHSYFNKFKACLKEAVDKDFIKEDPSRHVQSVKEVNPERTFLTKEEVSALAHTPCRYDVLKRAFIFSCLTGLRWSDIQKMTWTEVSEVDGNTRITFTQKKTKNLEYLDITPQAVTLMGERRNPSERVFEGLKYSTYINTEIVRWAAAAGITKPVTFHTGRHTFAVMMIDLGVDIYTVQKLLGHTEIKTTQIYAKMLDKNKQKAVNLIPDLL